MIDNILFYIMFGGFTVLSGTYVYIMIKKTKQVTENLDKNKLTVEV